jgi:deoxyribose-phosphate aldolase
MMHQLSELDRLPPREPLDAGAVALRLDHTLLRPDARVLDIELLCEEALEWNVRAVCVQPRHLRRVVSRLENSGVRPCTVIGFPHGATYASVRVQEALAALADGAEELDMVIPLGALRDREYRVVESEIRAVVEVAQGPALVKVILETACLDEEEIQLACRLSEAAGAAFVKTSTGYGTRGASVADVKLMRRVVGDRLGVKASGGIRDLATARLMLEAGASRLGTSSTVAILRACTA